MTLDVDVFIMRIQVNFSNLLDTVTAANWHGNTLMPFTGTAIVATQLPSLPGFPTGVTNGTYDQSIDLTLQSSYNPEYFAANGGTVALVSSAFYFALQEGRTYFNINTNAFPSGETRGFAGVPEPSTTALLSAGVVAAAVGFWRRRCKG